MPELPEVDTIRAQLTPVLTGRQLVGGWSHPSAKFTDAVEAVGTTIEAVGRRGKYLISPLDDGRELIVHLGMTGSLRVVGPAARAAADADPYVRAWWDLGDGGRLVFRDVRRFGRIAVLEAGRYESLPTLATLGPDPFDAEFDGDALWAGLRTSSRHLKTQLLSQRPVAGVGNIYADEALWRAGINPAARRVGKARVALLHEGIRDALALGLANGGTTLRDYRTVTGEPGRNQAALACYGRSGLPCLRCGTTLRHASLDARTSTWCPVCQAR